MIWGSDRGGGSGGRVGGVRVDVNEELKVLGEFTKKNSGGRKGGSGGGRVGGGQGGRERNVGGRGRCGVWGM